MATTYIDTNQCPQVKDPGSQGTVAEIVNKELCGAENVIGMLRWLGDGERFKAEASSARHQLIYLLEGSGVITLEKKTYPVAKGAGIYLGPSETASISHTGSVPLKLLHLIVRKA